MRNVPMKPACVKVAARTELEQTVDAVEIRIEPPTVVD
jgi:hypothetical protein